MSETKEKIKSLQDLVILFNGEEYVLKKSTPETSKRNTEGLEYVIVYISRSGFALSGYLKEIVNNKDIVLTEARYLGNNFSNPNLIDISLGESKKCVFSSTVEKIILLNVDIILSCSEKGRIGLTEALIYNSENK